MAKRLTDTERWNDPWYRKLPVAYKNFWDYICARCDNAGVWKVDMEMAQFQVDRTIDEAEAMKLFEGRVSPLKEGYWLINGVVSFLFGELSQESKVHRSVLQLIEKHRVSKGYPEGIHTLNNKNNNITVVKDVEVRERSGEGSKVSYWFEKTWMAYPKDRRVGKKAAFRSYQRDVKTLEDAKAVARALENYQKSKTVLDGYIKNGSTFFANWRDYADERHDSQGFHSADADGRSDPPGEGHREQIAATHGLVKSIADSKTFGNER